MEKIKIKLKECCLDCEHFDERGIVGLGNYVPFTNDERVIACGHMAVCMTYNREDDNDESA